MIDSEEMKIILLLLVISLLKHVKNFYFNFRTSCL